MIALASAGDVMWSVLLIIVPMLAGWLVTFLPERRVRSPRPIPGWSGRPSTRAESRRGHAARRGVR